MKKIVRKNWLVSSWFFSKRWTVQLCFEYFNLMIPFLFDNIAVVLAKSPKKGIWYFPPETYPPLGCRYTGIVWNIHESRQKNLFWVGVWLRVGRSGWTDKLRLWMSCLIVIVVVVVLVLVGVGDHVAHDVEGQDCKRQKVVRVETEFALSTWTIDT